MTFNNTIIHGDCIQALAQLDPASVDFVLTDPPYLVNYRARDGRSVTNDANSDWLRPAFSQIHRVLKPSSFCVSFYAWNRIHLFMDAWRSAGFRPVGHFVFRKRYASSACFLRYEHEAAYLLAKGDVEPPAKPISDVIVSDVTYVCVYVYDRGRWLLRVYFRANSRVGAAQGRTPNPGHPGR